jgi:hypothetical protein
VSRCHKFKVLAVRKEIVSRCHKFKVLAVRKEINTAL